VNSSSSRPLSASLTGKQPPPTMWLDGAHPIAAPPAGLASRRGAPASGAAARRNPNAADGEADGMMMEQCAAHDDVAPR
jgi:hypothetical protein